MIAYFNRFHIEMTLAQANEASHQGICDEDVAALVKHPKIARQLAKINADDIRSELREYGAWETDELMDSDANNARIIWIAAGDILNEQYEKQRRA